jgi:hypothetical protein
LEPVVDCLVLLDVLLELVLASFRLQKLWRHPPEKSSTSFHRSPKWFYPWCLL